MTIEVAGEELQKQTLNPEGQEVKTYSEDEYKNAQAFGTKAQQDRIALAEKLVTLDPKQLETMEDISLQKKVIGNLYGATDLEELKIIRPDLFSGAKQDEDDEDEIAKLKQKVKIMEYKNNQGALNSALDEIISKNKDLTDTIPNFKEKMLEEIKYISADMSINDRVARGFKIVAGTNSGQDAYLALQGQTIIKNTNNEKPSDKKEDLKEQLKKLIF